MKFKMTPNYFKGLNDGTSTEFTEHDPPSWMVCKDNLWWWKKHVLTLEIGESVNTDFQTIERIE